MLVHCSARVAACAYQVELASGVQQLVVGEELTRAYTFPTGTFLIRSLHVMAIAETAAPTATHFVIGVESDEGEVIELASWPLAPTNRPTLSDLADAGDPVLVESEGVVRLIQDSTSIDECFEQCDRNFHFDEQRIWGVLLNELTACDNLGAWDFEKRQNLRDCAADGVLLGGLVGGAVGFCVVGIPVGTAAAVPCSVVGPVGTVGGFCVGVGVGGAAGVLTGGGLGALSCGVLGACWGWFTADEVCKDAAWDRYELGILNAAAAHAACRMVQCDGNR